MFEDTPVCNDLDSIYLWFWYSVTELNLNQPRDKHYFNVRKFWRKQQISMTQCHGNIQVLNLGNAWTYSELTNAKAYEGLLTL
jgi:hypothetical protein